MLGCNERNWQAHLLANFAEVTALIILPCSLLAPQNEELSLQICDRLPNAFIGHLPDFYELFLSFRHGRDCQGAPLGNSRSWGRLNSDASVEGPTATTDLITQIRMSVEITRIANKTKSVLYKLLPNIHSTLIQLASPVQTPKDDGLSSETTLSR